MMTFRLGTDIIIREEKMYVYKKIDKSKAVRWSVCVWVHRPKSVLKK